MNECEKTNEYLDTIRTVTMLKAENQHAEGLNYGSTKTKTLHILLLINVNTVCHMPFAFKLHDIKIIIGPKEND